MRTTTLASGALALSIGLAGPDSLNALFSGLRHRLPDELDLDEFRAEIGSQLLLRGEDGRRFPARIARVREYAVHSRLQQFTVLFESELREPSPQGIYQIEHPQLGIFELLIVPVVSRRTRIDYEAAFTRFLG